MTKEDKYIKDDVNKDEMYNDFYDYLIRDGVYGCNSRNIVEKLYDFLNSSTAPTLTEEEKVILRNIDKRYKYIGRTDYNARIQYLYVNVEDEWKPATLDPLDHLFKFIKERRRI